jgi:brefeldin A-resistance guanine nucleotide exchange factor 1
MKVKVRGKRSEKLQETVPDLLKSSLLAMKMRGILAQRSALGGDSLWELTWLHVNNISPSLQLEVFPEQDSEHFQHKQGESIGSLVPDDKVSVSSSEIAGLEDAGIVR